MSRPPFWIRQQVKDMSCDYSEPMGCQNVKRCLESNQKSLTGHDKTKFHVTHETYIFFLTILFYMFYF